MANKITIEIPFGKLKAPCTLTKSQFTVTVDCPAANISQEFLLEDLLGLLIDLPNLIEAEQNHGK